MDIFEHLTKNINEVFKPLSKSELDFSDYQEGMFDAFNDLKNRNKNQAYIEGFMCATANKISKESK